MSKEKIRPICKKCADNLKLTPLASEFILCEPCSDCGSFAGTQFTDFLKPKV